MPPRFSYPALLALFLSTTRIAGHAHRDLFRARPHRLRDVAPVIPLLTVSQSGARRYRLLDQWKGSNFFDGFSFFSDPWVLELASACSELTGRSLRRDPTHGIVNYLDADTATHTGLAYVQNDGVVVIKVDNTTNLPNGTPRNRCDSIPLLPIRGVYSPVLQRSHRL